MHIVSAFLRLAFGLILCSYDSATLDLTQERETNAPVAPQELVLLFVEADLLLEVVLVDVALLDVFLQVEHGLAAVADLPHLLLHQDVLADHPVIGLAHGDANLQTDVGGTNTEINLFSFL
eukprot:scaffold26896_cov33-Prasinocladus_malaysianus.AAC.1